jgi:hypothetical protein
MTPIGVPVEWLRKRVEGYPDQGIPPAEAWDHYRIRLLPEDLPWRSPKSIKLQREGYSATQVDQRADGAWEGASDCRALEDYSDELCMVGLLPDRPTWAVMLGFDHGKAAGHQVCIVLLWDDGRPLYRGDERRPPCMVVIDEYVNTERSNTEQDAAAIREKLLAHDPPIQVWDIDKARGDINVAGKARETLTVNEDFSALLGIHVAPAIKGRRSVEDGIHVINKAFRRGILKIHARCEALRRTCLYWDGSDDDYKHLFDGLSYIAVPELKPVFRGGPGPEVRLP